MYRSPTTEDLGNLDSDLSILLKVKSDGAIGLPIYGFLLMFNNKVAIYGLTRLLYEI